MSLESMIWFDHEKCTQCHGCEVACRSWRGLAVGVSFRRVLTVWQGVFPAVINQSVAIGCLHCVAPACMDVCPVEAIFKGGGAGLVTVDSKLCIGCKECFNACLYGVPQFCPDGGMQKCDLCVDQVGRLLDPPCVETCPGDALSLRTVEPGEKEEQQLYLLKKMGKE